MKRNWLYGIVVIAVVLSVWGLEPMVSFAATTPINFTGFTGSGFAPSPAAGQLDSDIWRVTGMSDGNGIFGGTHTTLDFARGASNGNVTTGGVYAFDVSGGGGDVILGIQPGTDDFTPGEITLRVDNTTGSTVTDVYISYEIWTRNDQNRANSLNFSYSTDDSTYTSVSSLNYTTPQALDASPSWVITPRSTTITGINLSNGNSIYLKWTGDDVSGTGSRDEYGIDDIEVRISDPTAVTLNDLSASTTPSPTPIAFGVLGLTAALLLRRRLVRSTSN